MELNTKELLACYYDDPHHDNLRLAHPGSSNVYQYTLADWKAVVTEDSAFMEAVDINRFTDRPDLYNTLDVACARVHHIVQRAIAGYEMRPADQQLILAIQHSLSDYARKTLGVAGYLTSRYVMDEG